MRALPIGPVLAAAAAVLGLIAAAPAGAATFGCSASAARVTVLSTNTVEPTTANIGDPACRTASATLSDPAAGLNPAAALVKPVSATAVAAYTSYDATKQSALAAGGVAGLRIGIAPTSAIALPQVSAPIQTPAGTALNAIPVTLPAAVTGLGAPLLTTLGLPSGASSITVDATPAVNALVPALRALPTLDLLTARSAMAYATAACSNGALDVSGSSQLAGVQVGGQDVSLDGVVNQAVTVLPSLPDVNFAAADPSNVTLPAFATSLLQSSNPLVTQAAKDALTSAIHDAVAAALATLQPVARPAVLANVLLKPGATTRNGTSVTQQALLASISVAGVRLVDIVIGEAKASEQGLDCSSASAPTQAAATLQCTTRKLVLVDVLQRGHRVRLTGVADQKYVGRTVSIVFAATGRTVAHARVAKDGSFVTTAPLPPAAVRDTNRARYTAKIRGERSLDLKLRRRMIVSSMSSRDGRVTIVGRVVPPLGQPLDAIVLTQRVSCTRMKVVKRFHPAPDGTFRVTVPAPRSGGATAVYRLSTFVRPSARSHRRVPTFTLPRAVVLHS